MVNLNSLAGARAQDAQIAEALGLEIRELPGGTFIVRPSDHQPVRELSCYSSDPVAFEALMQEIGRRGLGEKWALAMLDALEITTHVWLNIDPMTAVWRVASAPQSTKAAAALATLTESQEAQT